MALTCETQTIRHAGDAPESKECGRRFENHGVAGCLGLYSFGMRDGRFLPLRMGPEWVQGPTEPIRIPSGNSRPGSGVERLRPVVFQPADLFGSLADGDTGMHTRERSLRGEGPCSVDRFPSHAILWIPVANRIGRSKWAAISGGPLGLSSTRESRSDRTPGFSPAPPLRTGRIEERDAREPHPPFSGRGPDRRLHRGIVIPAGPVGTP
jgi:hypothetical protein